MSDYKVIPEATLARRASPPSATEMEKIKNAKNVVEKALKDFLPIESIKSKYSLSFFDFEVYLQGSYKNSTNIRFDSDIDIVVQLNSVRSVDSSQLSFNEKALVDKNYSDSAYSFKEFKTDIFNAIKKYFWWEVSYWNKCIKIKGNTYRVDADLIPCFQHRRYMRFGVLESERQYKEGMKLYDTSNNEPIINFPKEHYRNGCAKNKDTEWNYKAMVRVCKNIKYNLVESGVIWANVAPSYFIENLVYNCSAHCFNGSYTSQLLSIFQFVYDAIEKKRIQWFICANEEDLLISSKTWNIDDLTMFITKASNYFLYYNT